LALTLFFTCVVVHFAAGWALQTWYYPSVLHGSYNPAWQRGLLFFRIPTLALWASLTFFIARKRLRSSVA
jgi:hypothetical protein